MYDIIEIVYETYVDPLAKIENKKFAIPKFILNNSQFNLKVQSKVTNA